MRVNLLIAMIIFALIWPATALRAAVSKTTWADAPAREFVFVENNSDDNFFVTPGGALDPRLTGCQPLDRFKIQWFRNHLSAKPRLH
ncbi:putative fimbrial protein [Escherichia coli]|uniref:Putative fimbrial protein n=1 Tax=Escherichia coli TaxID=562 RepID=A0A376LJG9_ECOLX|nr:putative fimbrial protein [Escherichia coli]